MPSLLVASAGGHLEELWLLRPRLTSLSPDVTWVTWDTPQSRSILGDEKRIFIRRAQPRDPKTAALNATQAWRILRQGHWDRVVSTGSAPAVPFLTLARTLGIPCDFIESAARVERPSLAGRILERIPGIHRYGQYPTWDRRGWTFAGSVFDDFTSEERAPAALRRVVVTVGSSRFGFRRMIEAVRAVLPGDAEVLWQTGWTDVSDLPIGGRAWVRADELSDAMGAADLVIAHAGVGSAITAMRAGHFPVLVPRRSSHHEHVDDHQLEIADQLAGDHLAVSCPADELSQAALGRALARRVVTRPQPTPFMLGGSGSSPHTVSDRLELGRQATPVP